MSTETLRADDEGAIRDFAARISASLRWREFSESDIEAFQISLRELVDNVSIHVRGDKTVQLELSHVERSPYTSQEGLRLEVTDRGKGFDFDDSLLRSEAELLERGVEHGLLRAYRLGSFFTQVGTEPHVMEWGRERFPQTVPTVFRDEDVLPFVFSYRQEAVRIWRDVHTFFQFQQYLRRSQAFMNLIFDPLQRPARRYVGIEIVGEGWTGVLGWRQVLDGLLSFTKQNARFNKRLLLFADTGPSEQRRLRDYCEGAGIVMFEDESAIQDLEMMDVPPVSRKAQGEEPGQT
jgi:anti-sigma regulatory factor (Ser/Thr protein kinase)